MERFIMQDLIAWKNREDRKPLYDRIRVWQPSETDYVFPKYSDGVDYSEKEEEYENS